VELSISCAFEKYRDESIIMRNQAAKTEEAYLNTSKLLVSFFGDILISTLDFEMIRKWHQYLSGYQRPDTVRNNIVNIRNVLKYLRRLGYEVIDYELIPVQKREKRRFKYLTEDEFNEFVAIAGAPRRGHSLENRLRNVAILEVLFATGLRNAELCSLDRDTIKNRSFTMIGKSRDPRIGFIDYRAESAINRYLPKRNDNNSALFISPQTGKRITPGTIRTIFANICNNSCFDSVTPRTIRHSYATKMLSKKVDIRHLGDLMGHVDLNTTKIYTHYTNPQLREIYENAHGILTNS